MFITHILIWETTNRSQAAQY